MKRNLIALSLMFLYGAGIAQTAYDELAQLMQDDSVDVNTVAFYPQNVREIIFQVSTHPEAVAKLADVQKNSTESFRNLIALYSKDEQQKIWNLTRYDKLIEQLAETKGKKRKVERVLKNFPAEIYDDGYDYAVNHPDLMVSIDKLDKSFDNLFVALAAGYSPEYQSALNRLLHTPEALSLLNRNMHLTVHLGDIYKSNPGFLRQQFDSLATVLAEQNAREKEEWKKEMQQNPDAERELKQSAEEYAKDNGYAQQDYRETDPQSVEHYVYVPYPYWCGYPWWYQYDYWYPYPYWYHWGFYYSYGVMVWTGPPSWYFLHWHFHHHHYYHHFHDYPHITNVYINHYYYGHRGSASNNTVVIYKWMKQNESSFPSDFRVNTAQRIDRIREFGRMEIDREKFNEANPAKTVTRDDYMRQHMEEYPHLKQPEELAPPLLPKETPAEIKKSSEKPAELPRKEKKKIDIEKPWKPITPSSPREKMQPKPVEKTPRIEPKTHTPEKQAPQPIPPKKEQSKPAGKGG